MSETKNLQARVPADLHQKLRLLALVQHKTITDLTIEVLTEYVERTLGNTSNEDVKIVFNSLYGKLGTPE